jgi:hypothetical protein
MVRHDPISLSHIDRVQLQARSFECRS